MAPLSFLLVGGTFDLEGGRPSGYFTKLAAALTRACPGAEAIVVNGGTYDALENAVERSANVTHVLWFADVPNTLPKLLPVLKQRYPGMLLVSSKNNRRDLYTREQLFERMRRSNSELLVEFNEGEAGRLVASVLTIVGTALIERSDDIGAVALALAGWFARLSVLTFPLSKNASTTVEADSFRFLDLARHTEVPLGSHPGAFGVPRKNHVHEGVDLYGCPGDKVTAMESGVVVGIEPFTGPSAGSGWWNETRCVLVRGAVGTLNYGELHPVEGLKVGSFVEAGQLIGELVTVLPVDKGRPRTMLHLERYTAETVSPIKEWSSGAQQPANLCSPSVLLVQAISAQGAGLRGTNV